MRKITFLLPVAALALGGMLALNSPALAKDAAKAATSPMAHGQMSGGCGMMGGGMAGLTPEQQVKYDAIMQEFQAKVFPLGQDLWAKNAELQAQIYSGKGDMGQMDKLIGDIKNLRGQMYQERQALNAKLRAEGLPVMGGGCGMMGGGMGMMGGGMSGGMGHGMGHGAGHGGMGRGMMGDGM